MRQLIWLGLLCTSAAVGNNLVYYAGDGGKQRINDVHALSDGTFLIAGQSEGLDWLPAGLPRTTLPAPGLDSAASGQTAFLLQLAADFATPLRVVQLPTGSARDVFKIRSTEVPGQATGSIFISGSRDGASVNGYYLARLNQNFVNAVPTALSYVYNVSAAGDHKERQPWDVGGDGAVVHAIGEGFQTQWAAIQKLNASGLQTVVEHWHAHWHAAGEWDGTPASSYPNAASAPLLYSAVVMKVNRRGSLRSTTAADYTNLTADANGNSGRQGRFPDDYYHAGPCELSSGSSCPNTGPGYTGYRAQNAKTQRVGSIAIDRRNNRLYFGYSTQSTLPGGNPDFEPAVVAMEANGSLRWWDRLYRETTANSPPDQYVDGLAIDHANDRLVVMARSHGNAVDNLWRGQQIALTPGAAGFVNQFTGTNGNIHISWLGKLRLSDGRVSAVSYVAELVEGSTSFGGAHPDPLLGGWPNPNGGWPNVNTTRCGADSGYSGEIAVGTDGAVAILCKGRRTATTIDALQTMPLPNVANPQPGAWNEFVRVFTPDLSALRYSSLLTGVWDPQTAAGADNTRLVGVALSHDAVYVAGWHTANAGVALGNPIRTVNAPAWASATPNNQSAIFARLRGTRLGTPAENLFEDGFETP